MSLTARQLYFEAVKVGDELPPLVKPPVDRLQIARYAGAAQDWNPLYLDEPHARNSGFPSALAPGVIAMGFVSELVVEWVRGARLRKLQCRFVKIIWPGDVLTARGRVVDRRFEEGGKYGMDVEVWAENHRGELVVRGLATFQLYYSAEDEARQRAGQPPLVVTPEEEEARLAKLSRAQPPRAAPPASRPMAPPRPIAAAAPPRPIGPIPGAPRPGMPPAAPRAAAPARSAAPRPAPRPAAKGKAKGGKAKASRAPKRAAAKRPASKEKSARSRARPARKPSGKKRR
jgi:acyl dehydratase